MLRQAKAKESGGGGAQTPHHLGSHFTLPQHLGNKLISTDLRCIWITQQRLETFSIKLPIFPLQEERSCGQLSVVGWGGLEGSRANWLALENALSLSLTLLQVGFHLCPGSEASPSYTDLATGHGSIIQLATG